MPGAQQTQHEQPSPVSHGGLNPSVQARHCCRQVPGSQPDLPQGCLLPPSQRSSAPCLCVPWPLPVVELINPDSLASLDPSLSPIHGVLSPATSPSCFTPLFGALS